MNEHETVSSWLETIGERYGVRGFTLDHGGTCTGSYHNTVEFALEVPQGQETVYLNAPVVPSFAVNGPVMAMALERNCFGLGTTQAWLGRRKNAGDLCLCSSLAVNRADAKSFENWLGNFLVLAEGIAEEFRANRPAADTLARAEPLRATPIIGFDPTRFA